MIRTAAQILADIADKHAVGPIDPDIDPDAMLRPGQIAAALGVNMRTVGAWAKTGLLPYTVTPGGHRRYRGQDVLDAIRNGRRS